MIDTSNILTLDEQRDIYDMVDVFDKLITDDIYDRSDSYELIESEETGITTVKVFDADNNTLVSIDVSDYDEALGLLEDLFDLDGLEEV